jgi:protein phosphatase 1 regulatory subunit 7
MLFHRMLDISFNRIPKIENLQNCIKLEKLFLVSNKISEIENISHLTSLTMLELGDNKIRVSLIA